MKISQVFSIIPIQKLPENHERGLCEINKNIFSMNGFDFSIKIELSDTNLKQWLTTDYDKLKRLKPISIKDSTGQPGFEINGVDTGYFGVTQETETHTQKDFCVEIELDVSEIESIAYAMAEKDVRYYLNGMLFSNSAIVATDGHRLAYREKTYSENEYETIIHRDAIAMILKAAKAQKIKTIKARLNTIYSGDKYSVFYVGSMTLTTVNIDGKFPNWRRIIPEQKDSFGFDKKELLATLKASLPFLHECKYKQIILDINKSGTCTLRTRDKKLATIKVDAETSIETSFNACYLIDAIKAVSDSTIILMGDALTTATINENNLVQPMRY